MHTPATHETQRLGEGERTVGMSLDTPRRSFKVVYRHRLVASSKTRRPNVGLGLVLGGLLMLGTLGYGIAPLGGLVLAALIVIAVWQAGGRDADD